MLFRSAVYAADVQPGDTVAVVGIGGIGANAIQGARLAGARVIAAIDPVEFKREKAMDFGATHTYASIEDAMGDLANSTWSRGFNKVIMTMGVGSGEVLGQAFWLAGKGSKISPLDGVGSKLSAAEIKQWLTDPDAMTAKLAKKPAVKMKKIALPDADVDNLVQYMLSLKK